MELVDLSADPSSASRLEAVETLKADNEFGQGSKPSINNRDFKEPDDTVVTTYDYRDNNGKVINEGGNISKSIEFITKLVDNCNQRKHDLPMGVKCSSNDLANCAIISDIPKEYKQTEDVVASVIVTSKSGLRLSNSQVQLERVDCSWTNPLIPRCPMETYLDIQLDSPQQSIIGFGGALSDSSISNILSLSVNGTNRLLEDYFGKSGLRYNIIRLTIGGSDFSGRFYTNDDLSETSDKSEDLELENFKLTEEDLLYKIPMVKLLQGRYNTNELKLKLFASMWSPPVWMKTNNHFNKGNLKGSIGNSTKMFSSIPEERYFKALASLKKKFLLAYSDKSIQFWGLTVMNEPYFSIQPFLDFNTMIFPQMDYANYVAKYLGPAIRGESQLRNMKIMVHDDNRRYLLSYTKPILDNKKTFEYVDGVSVHGYIDEDYKLMDKIYYRYKPEKKSFFILPTELCSGHLPFMDKALIGNWHRGIHYALDIVRSLKHSAAGWVDWNMALDTTGGPGWLGGRLDSPVIVDKSADAYYKSPMFYVIGQFSRYITPGSVRLKTEIINQEYQNKLETVTFLLNDNNRIVTVVVNNNPMEVFLNLRVVSSADQSESPYFRLTIQPDSVTTIIYNKNLNITPGD